MITLHHYLILGTILFTIGLMGLVIRRNLLIIFMCIEILLNSVNLIFVALARYFNLMDGHVVVFFVMAVAAAEAGIGLAIVMTLFRKRQTIKVGDWNLLKG
ncbi:MAG: NADH dehydrogenase I subunit K [uncultured bacterium]|nr:MAG: NADH dehydrogenase I subunit K [uncultured bacterium]